MKAKIEPKGFDCVAFKRQAQARIYEDIEGLSGQAQIAYFRRRAERGPFAGLVKRLEERRVLSVGS